MPDLPPLFLSRDRIQQGLTPNEIARRAKAGILVRVRHGVYVDGETWTAMKPSDCTIQWRPFR